MSVDDDVSSFGFGESSFFYESAMNDFFLMLNSGKPWDGENFFPLFFDFFCWSPKIIAEDEERRENLSHNPFFTKEMGG